MVEPDKQAVVMSEMLPDVNGIMPGNGEDQMLSDSDGFRRRFFRRPFFREFDDDVVLVVRERPFFFRPFFREFDDDVIVIVRERRFFRDDDRRFFEDDDERFIRDRDRDDD